MGIYLKKLLPGKLDHDFLDSLLKRFTFQDERVVAGAKVGEDATVIDMGDRYLLAKTDPITFATEHIGHYAVHVNINDISCMGAAPKWFLATILLPEKATSDLAEDIFSQLSDVCRQEKIVYCGGHTEVTVGLDRPLVIGQMLGEVEKDKLVVKDGAQENDRILLVRRIPVEGTAIIAFEKYKELEETFSSEFVERCKNMLFDPGISVRREAEIAVNTAKVHAMHDPTEGGVATAIHELSLAAQLGCEIYADKIPVMPEGKLACDMFDMNPLGVISSGALLLAVPPKSVNPIMQAYEENDIIVAEIGTLLHKDRGMVLIEDERKVPLPVFPQDEIVKIF